MWWGKGVCSSAPRCDGRLTTGCCAPWQAAAYHRRSPLPLPPLLSSPWVRSSCGRGRVTQGKLGSRAPQGLAHPTPSSLVFRGEGARLSSPPAPLGAPCFLRLVVLTSWHVPGTQMQLISHFDQIKSGVGGHAAAAGRGGPGGGALLEDGAGEKKKDDDNGDSKRHRSVHALPGLSKEDMLLVALLDCRDIEYLEVPGIAEEGEGES